MLRRLSALLLTAAALAGTGAFTAPASADPISRLQSGGVGYGVYIVKDMGGGAYWNVTTNSMYVIAAGSDALIGAAATTADLVATLASNGRDLLLLINGAVLVPLTNKLSTLPLP
jgi:hypothetical protein